MRILSAGAILALAAVLLAGCGGSGDKDARRDAVNAYLDQVTRAQEPVLAENAAINEALASFSLRPMAPAKLQALVRAEKTIESSIARVRALEPPPDAERLHRRVLRLLELQSGLVGELVWTARYVRENVGADEPLKAAGAALSRDLGGAENAQQLSDAFATYRASLGRILARLDELEAPPLLTAGLESQRRTLRRAVAVCGEIIAALGKGDVDAANARIADLLAVSETTATVRTRKAEIAAAKAYNARVERLDRLGADIARERQALVLELA
jgi:hypothetical protein